MPVKLETVYGTISISADVIGKITGTEATRCVGVVGMAYKSRTDGLVSVLKKDSVNKGVKVTFSDNKIILELHIIIEYGINISAVSQNIVENVKFAVERTTGYEVEQIVINVESVRVEQF